MDKYSKRTWYKEQGLETVVAGIPHSFGFGGVHGATATPIHKTGQLLHVDVNNYYPSMLIAWGLVTRAATVSVQGTVNFGGKATDTAMVTISTDFNETIRADMDAKAASGVVQVDFIEIKTT